MSKAKRKANYSYLIETLSPSGERLLFWRIDQLVSSVRSERGVERANNSIERHLHDLSVRTGLGYSCFAQGPIEEVDKCIESMSIDVSPSIC